MDIESKHTWKFGQEKQRRLVPRPKVTLSKGCDEWESLIIGCYWVADLSVELDINFPCLQQQLTLWFAGSQPATNTNLSLVVVVSESGGRDFEGTAPADQLRCHNRGGGGWSALPYQWKWNINKYVYPRQQFSRTMSSILGGFVYDSQGSNPLL